MLRPAILDDAIYPEVAGDPYATVEAAAVVLLTSALFALGHAGLGVEMVAAQFVGGVVLWLVGIGVAYYLGTEVAPGLHNTTWRRTFRALAFAGAPRSIGLLLVLPGVGVWFVAAAMALTIAAYTQAILYLFDVDLRTAGSIALGANIAQLIGFVVVLLILA